LQCTNSTVGFDDQVVAQVEVLPGFDVAIVDSQALNVVVVNV